ncbi:hypothetical protein D3C80_2004210 [compost metagenome]
MTAQARGQAVEGVLGLGHVEQHHLGTVTGQGFRDGGTDAPGGTGNQGALAGQRSGPVTDLLGAGV